LIFCENTWIILAQQKSFPKSFVVGANNYPPLQDIKLRDGLTENPRSWP